MSVVLLWIKHFFFFRDGSAVEIVGLCKSALKWLIDAYGRGQYRFSAVSRMGKIETLKIMFLRFVVYKWLCLYVNIVGPNPFICFILLRR